jgi:myo-inositol-1(or 4)-monophosphatase
MCHSIRSLGSAALNFAMVAQGGFDLYWFVLQALHLSVREFLIRTFKGGGVLVRTFSSFVYVYSLRPDPRYARPWDVCAGAVIAQEAGCLVTGGHELSKAENGFEMGEEMLTGRKYLVVRAIADVEVRSGRPFTCLYGSLLK